MSTIDTDAVRMLFVFADHPDNEHYRRLAEHLLDMGCRPRLHESDEGFSFRINDEVSHQEAPLSEAVDQILDADRGWVTLYYHELKFSVGIWSNRSNSDDPTLSLRVWSSQFETYENESDADVRARVSDVLDIVGIFTECLKPIYAYGGGPFPAEQVDVVMNVQQVRGGKLPELFWLNVFPPTLVEQIGSDRVRTAPAWKVVELQSGHVLLVVTDNPVFPSVDWEDAKAEIVAHFESRC
jgi:hypothetical protein